MLDGPNIARAIVLSILAVGLLAPINEYMKDNDHTGETATHVATTLETN